MNHIGNDTQGCMEEWAKARMSAKLVLHSIGVPSQCQWFINNKKHQYRLHKDWYKRAAKILAVQGQKLCLNKRA